MNSEHSYLLQKLAEKKYKNTHDAYHLPYQYVKEQNQIGNLYDSQSKIITQGNISPYNENWVLDDKEERSIVGAVEKDDSILYSINGGLTTTNKEFLDRIDPKLMEVKKKSLGYVAPSLNTPIPNPTRYYIPKKTPRPTRPNDNVLINTNGLFN